MSIQSEITRIAGNVSDALTAIAAKGVTVPSGSNSDDLADLIAQITGGGSGGVVITDTLDSHGGTIREITAVEISGTKTISANGTGIDVTEYAAVDVAVPAPAPVLQQKTNITPSGSSQTISPDAGYDGLASVQIDPIPSQYIVPTGTKAITANGTGIDVAAYATVDVAVPTGPAKAIQVYSGYASRTANSYGATDVTITVAKSGTYKVSWCAARGSSSGTMGTRLRINSTDGTAQQTWTGTYWQCVTLTNQTLNKDDVLTVYATSGSTTRSVYVGNLIIEEV